MISMRRLLPIVLLGSLALGSCSSQAAESRPPAGASSAEPIDLMEQLGIRLPEGDVLAKMIADAARHPLGSKENPVRAAGPAGQRAYLARLRCGDGRQPTFQRAFSAGMGPFGRILDSYSVTCGEERREVFLDMYHDHIETAPIPGFTIAPATSR